MSLPLDYPTEDEIRWLFAHGVSDAAIFQPTPIRAARVRFLDQRAFEFADIGGVGERALVFVGESDLVAWQPRQGALATWRGVAFCLGDIDQVFNPATYFCAGALRVHADPLAWLKAEREGIVSVQPRFTYAYLRHVPRLAFSTAAHARQVRAWLEPPKPRVEFLVKIPEEMAAA
jgi:hypothetical protein